MLQKIVRSTVIDAPIERVWAVLRDFNSHDQWHSAVDQSRIEAGDASDQVGCVRNFTLKSGDRIREQLIGLDDRQFKSTYCIVEATVPLQRYVATVTLKPITDGNRTFWHWESSFATPPGRERELRELVAGGVYEAGFANLRQHLRDGADWRTGASAGAGAGAAVGTTKLGLPLPMRHVVVQAYGDAQQLTLRDAHCPAPAAGEVRIQQRAIGVNYIDVYLRRGWIPPMLAPGQVPGMEAAGSVIDVGEGVHGFLPGDRVAYLSAQPGSYASVRCVSASCVVRLPAAVDDDVAAALLLKGLTAEYLVHELGRIRPGTRVLLHSAAGGVGLLFARWARHFGASVVGTVSSPEKAVLAREHGCEHVIVTRDYRFADAMQQLVGGADVLIDTLGEQAKDENLAALARRGHWISLGQVTGGMAGVDPNALVSKSITFSRPVVFDFVANPNELRERSGRLWSALADGTLRCPPIERHTLASAAQAHARLESRQTTGALVLLV
jgi:NADPH:quinone reductase